MQTIERVAVEPVSRPTARTNRAHVREGEELGVQPPELLAPRPRHEVLVLVDGLATLWARLPLTVPLEVANRPNRDLVACASDAVAERVRPDTEVTVLLPRHGDRGRFRRLLHDQTGRDLLAALNRLDGVNVAIVHPPAAPVLHRAAAPPAHPTGP
jgi:hypothetical protein